MGLECVRSRWSFSVKIILSLTLLDLFGFYHRDEVPHRIIFTKRNEVKYIGLKMIKSQHFGELKVKEYTNTVHLW